MDSSILFAFSPISFFLFVSSIRIYISYLEIYDSIGLSLLGTKPSSLFADATDTLSPVTQGVLFDSSSSFSTLYSRFEF
jgi:hypothetical protein